MENNKEMTSGNIIKTIQLSLVIAYGILSGSTTIPATAAVHDTTYTVRSNVSVPDSTHLPTNIPKNNDLEPIEPEFPIDPPGPSGPIKPIYPPEEDIIPIDTENNYAVGTPKGTFDVNGMGAAVYSVPIECPNGGTLMPSIGIVYNSQAGHGIAGYGFSISGMSAITRGGSNLHSDGKLKGTTYTADDNLFLDGKRLILQSGTAFCEGAAYTVEGDPYTKITVHGTYGYNVATTWFEVHAADGTLYRYGDSASSRLGYTNKNGAQRIASWHISSAEDMYSNYITYTYETSNLNIRPVCITYGTNRARNRGLVNTIEFAYRDAGDRAFPFVIEGRQGKADVLLNAITTATNGMTYRRYEFTYDEKSDLGNTKFSRLVKIDELNGDGEKLSPVKFDWDFMGNMYVSGHSIDVPTKSAANNISETSRLFTSADLNGDGISDIIRISQAYILDYLIDGTTHRQQQTLVNISRSRISNNNTVTYDYPITFSLPPTFAVDNIESVIGGSSVMDFDGDGYNDMLFPLYSNTAGSRAVCLCTIFGSDIKSGNTGNIRVCDIPLSASTECPLFCTFDADGNGKDEILFVETSSKDGCYHGKLAYHTGSEKLKHTDLLFTMPSKPEKMFTADFNNDGLADIILLYNGGYTIYYNNGSTPSEQYFTEGNKKTGTDFTNNWRVQQGDFDGDGLMDFVYNVSPETWLRIARNNGDGTFTHGRSEDLGISDQSTSKDDNKFSILVWDMNNDGKSDVFVSKANYEHHGGISGRNDYKSTTIKWLYSDGTTLKVFKETDKYHPEDATQGNLMLGDFNGDGAVELANYGTMLNSVSETIDEKIHVYSTGTSSAQKGRIKCITDGLGRDIRIQYASAALPSVYTKATDNKYPVNNYCLPIAVVSSTSISNGASAEQHTKYRYGGLKLHIAGKGMLGFTEITKENTTTGIKETLTVTKRDESRFIPTETTKTVTVGSSTSTTTVRTTVADKDNNNYFAYVSEKKVIDLDGNTTTAFICYDTDKGVITEETVKDDGDNMYRKTSCSGYIRKGSKWLPSAITSTQKHKDSDVPFVCTTEYTYDERGNVLTKTENSGTDMALTTSATYDVYGNVLSSQSSGQGVISVTKHNDYDESGRFVTKTYETPSSAVNVFTYDTWGNLLEETDMTEPENPLTTSHTYDGWGRKTSTTEPDGTWTEWSTAWGLKNKFRYCISESSSSRPWVNTWYDECSRETFVETVGEKGVDITKETTYEKHGNISQTESKTGLLAITENFTYDERGRILSAVSSTGRTTEYSYGNRMAVCTVAGRGYTKTYDAWGNVTSSTDPVSEVTYTYSSNGKPEKIDADGCEVTMTYDAAGNRTSLTDPDAGTSTYTYAADGRLLSETDGRGIKTEYTFDTSGRLVASVAGAMTTTYTYGTSGYNTQRITKKETGDNAVEYTYDRYGRVTEEKRTIGDKGIYTFGYTYNKDNRLERTCYPGGLEVNYLYDEYGFRTQVKTGDNVICNVEDYDGLSYTTSFMGKLTSAHTRDARGFVNNRSLSRGTDSLETLSLNYEGSTGNLLSRKRGDTAEETFGYDSLDRLVSVCTGGEETMNVTYAPNGNILNKTGIGNYEYDGAHRPHAVRVVDNTDRLISDDILNTAYNDLGKIKRIEKRMLSDMADWTEISKDTMSIGLDTSRVEMSRPMDAGIMTCASNNIPFINISRPFIMDFVYGPDGERWYSSMTNCGRVLSSTVYAGDYEKVTNNGVTREFYYLDDNIIIIRQDGEFKPYIAFTDNLGSILSITDEEGNKVFNASYDPWGKQTVTLNTIDFQRGYTGHEMLNSFGIINMNGRLYDPLIGRFLSPDNYVQMPDNSQNFNRYSYCLNNPLKYNDPSGEFVGADDIIACLLGGTINLTVNLIEGNVKNFWHGAALFATGALAGECALYGQVGASAIIVGAGISILNQGFANGWKNIDWGQVGMSGGMSLLTSAIGGELGNLLSKPLGNLTSSISNTVLRNVVYNSLCNTATGFVLGTGFSVLGGSGVDIKTALKAGLENAGIGFMTGAMSGFATGIQETHYENRQKSFNSTNDTDFTLPEDIVRQTLASPKTPTGSGTNSVYIGRDADGNARYVGITEREPQIRFSEHLKSQTNRSKLQYKTIDGTGQLNRIQSRIIEQNLINMYGLGKNNGILYNIRNSIAPRYWNNYGIKNK